MKFKHTKFLIILFLIIISSLLIGIKTKKSFDFSKIENFDINSYTIYSSKELESYYSKITDYDDLFQQSDLILKISMTDSIEIVTRCTLSEVKVLSVLKGDLAEDEIYIYEPYIVRTNNSSVLTYTGYLPMRANEEYIVCLKSIEVPEGYKKTDKQKKSYMLVDPIFGKYNIENSGVYITDTPDDSIQYENIKTNDVILTPSQLPKYNQIKNSLQKLT